MATICIDIPDASLARVRDGFTGYHGYQSVINGSPNPETKAQFAKRKVAEYMKRCVIEFEANAAAQTAGDSARTDAGGLAIT